MIGFGGGGGDGKVRVSLVLCAVALPLAFANRWLAVGLFVLVPDRRIEDILGG